MSEKLTKEKYLNSLVNKGYRYDVARDVFRNKYGYFPEEVGRDYNLRDLESDRRDLPRDQKTGEVLELYGPRDLPEGSYLPSPAKDENELKTRLSNLNLQGLDVHPRHVGRAVPQAERLPQGRRQEDVVSFSTLMPNEGEPPAFDLTFVDDLPVPETGPEFEDPEGDARKVRGLRTAREAKQPISMPQNYRPAINLEVKEQESVPGIDRRLRRMVKRLRVFARPGMEDASEVERRSAMEAEEADLGQVDLRSIPEDQVKEARNRIDKADMDVRKYIYTKARQLAKEQDMPEEDADKAADAFIQAEYARDDKQVAQRLWFALARGHDLVADRRQLSIEDLLKLPAAIVKQRSNVFVPMGTTDAGPLDELVDVGSEEPSLGPLSNKKYGNYVKWLWSQLSRPAKERLLSTTSLSEYKTVENLDKAFLESPFAIHPDDIRRMYNDRSRKTQKKLRETGLADRPEQDAARDFMTYWAPWAPIREESVELESRIQGRVYDQLYSERKKAKAGALYRTFRQLAAAGQGLVEGITEGLAEGGGEYFRQLLSPMPKQTLVSPDFFKDALSPGGIESLSKTPMEKASEFLPEGSPGYELLDAFIGDPRYTRKLLPQERDAMRSVFMARNNALPGGNSFDYLTDRQIGYMRNAKGLDKTPYMRVKKDIEKLVVEQSDKEFVTALSEEVGNFIEMVPFALEATAGYTVMPNEQVMWVKDYGDLLAKSYASSRDFWKDAGVSVIADLALLTDDPIRHFKALPITTGLMLLQSASLVGDAAMLTKFPPRLRSAWASIQSKASKLQEALGILSNPVTRAGWNKLKQLKGVVSRKALEGYYSVLEKMDPVLSATKTKLLGRRVSTKYRQEFLDKAAAVEAEASNMLNFIFREAKEPAVGAHDSAMAKWIALQADPDNPRTPSQALMELDKPAQTRMLDLVEDRLMAERAIPRPKAGSPRAERIAYRKHIEEALLRLQDQNAANDMGRVLLNRSGKNADIGDTYTLERPFNIATNIIEESSRMARRGEDGIPLRPPGEGSQAARRGFGQIHSDPEVVIALLEDMLENRSFWVETAQKQGINIDQLATHASRSKALKKSGAFGRAVPSEVLDRLNIESNIVLRAGDDLGFPTDPKLDAAFTRNVKSAIEDLKRYRFLNNKARSNSGLPMAAMDDVGTVVKDPFHRRGTWVHEDTLKYLENQGMSVLDTEINAGSLKLREDAGHGRILRQFDLPIDATDEMVKSTLYRIAHQLRLEGINKKMSISDLQKNILEAIGEGRGKVPKGAAARSKATVALINELQEASFDSWRKGLRTKSGTVPVVTEAGDIAARAAAALNPRKRIAELRRLAESDDIINSAVENAYASEALRAFEEVRTATIRDAVLSEAAGVDGVTPVQRVVNSMDNAEVPTSLPAVMTVEDGSGASALARIQDDVTKARDRALNSALGDPVKRKQVEAVYRDIRARLDRYEDFGWDPKKARYDASLREYYGLPKDTPLMMDRSMIRQLVLDKKFNGELSGSKAIQLFQKIMNLGKSAEVVYNPPSIAANIASNYTLVYARRGVTPIQLTRNMLDTQKAYLRWQVTQGKRKPSRGIERYDDQYIRSEKGRAEKAKFDALREAGINYEDMGRMAQDVVSRELEQRKFRPTSMATAPFRKAGEVLRKTHKAGDDLFRGEYAGYAYDWNMKRLQSMDVGDTYSFQYGPNRMVRLKKESTGYRVIDGPEKGKLILTDDPFGNNKLRALNARAAAYAANEMFVPYGDIPNWPARVRAWYALGPFSSHFTWAFHATPRPGSWGIFGTTFKDPIRSFTNSKAALRSDIGRRTKLLARNTFLQGMEAQYADENNEALRMAHNYDPLQVGKIMGYKFKANPLLVGTDSMRNISYGEPAVKMFTMINLITDRFADWFGNDSKPEKMRNLLSAASGVGFDLKSYGYSASSYDDLPKDERAKLYDSINQMSKALMTAQRGREFPIALNLVGLAGNRIVDIWEVASDEGKTMDWNRLYNKAAPMLITGAGKRAIDGVAGLASDEFDWSKWVQNKKAPMEQQVSGLAYIMDQFVSMGFTPKVIEDDFARTKRKLSQAWKSSLLPSTIKYAADVADQERIVNNEAEPIEKRKKAAQLLQWRVNVLAAIKEMLRNFENKYYTAKREREYVLRGLKGATPMRFATDLGQEEMQERDKQRQQREQGRMRQLK
jgi:hypothetical protein